MDLKRLQVFCKVVELKSFSRAAEAVLLSQPTVSEHIRILEDNFGGKLLDRLGREVLTTSAGQLLYGYARRIVQLSEEAEQALRQFQGDLSGALTLGASTIPGAYILPELLRSFKSVHPSIQVTLKIAGTSRTAKDLLEGDLEVGILGAPWKDPRLETSEIFSDELVLAVHPRHPWVERGEVPLEELAQEPFILRERGSGTRLVLTKVLLENGIDISRLTLVAEMGSSEAVRQGIKAGLGISVLSALSVEEDVRRESLAIVPIRGIRMLRPFFLARRKNREPSPLCLAFLDHLQSANGSPGKRP